MYYEHKNSILDVPEDSKETSVTLKGNNGGLGGLTEDPVGIQTATFSAYMAKMAFDFAGTPGTPYQSGL